MRRLMQNIGWLLSGQTLLFALLGRSAYERDPERFVPATPAALT